MKKIYQEFIKKLKDEKTNDLNKVFPKKEDLIDLLEELINAKEYGLVWDKEKVPEDVVEECKSKTPYLKYVKERSVKEKGNSQNNILIEGDNYASLLALNQTHKGKVDLIYIDPPYNTGQDFVYNDKRVNKDDGYRHSKWLNFMEKRLNLVKDLLSKTGTVFISIDNNEKYNLKLLCDITFGEENFISTSFILDNLKGKENDNFISEVGHSILIYAKNKSIKEELGGFNKVENNFGDLVEKKYKYKDKFGVYTTNSFKKTGSGKKREDRAYMYYPILWKGCFKSIRKEEFSKIYNKNNNSFNDAYLENLKNFYERQGFKFILPISQGIKVRWTSSFDSYNKLIEKEELILNEKCGVEQKKRPKPTELLSYYTLGTRKSLFYKTEYSNATNDFKKIIGDSKFDNPKSVYLILDVLKITSQKDSVILDFFAGSGTTGHAVLKLNKEDKGKRKFILCTNNENNICEEVTYERIKKVIQGYKKNGNGEFIEGLGGRLEYYKIDFINKINVNSITENDKFRISRKIGVLLGLKEDCLDEVEFSKGRYQIFKNDKGKFTGIYFEENFDKMEEFREKLKGKKGVFYSYSGGMKKEYLMDGKEFERIRLVKIPTEFLNIYKDCIL